MTIIRIGATALLGALFAAPGHAQTTVPDVNATVQVDPAVDPDIQTESNDTPMSSEPAPATAPATPSVTTTPQVVTSVEPVPETLENPYANSYNVLLPLEEEREQGFDDWGLLGLLGMLGLFSLRRRDRVVYRENERNDDL
ncbi:MAG: hypothetical protein M3Q15_05985 [Pseudomonadota bacterium]|nr:hypothetical protein [Pseudomonadota bacterium]